VFKKPVPGLGSLSLRGLLQRRVSGGRGEREEGALKGCRTPAEPRLSGRDSGCREALDGPRTPQEAYRAERERSARRHRAECPVPCPVGGAPTRWPEAAARRAVRPSGAVALDRRATTYIPSRTLARTILESALTGRKNLGLAACQAPSSDESAGHGEGEPEMRAGPLAFELALPPQA
jgi:hypothetical protein